MSAGGRTEGVEHRRRRSRHGGGGQVDGHPCRLGAGVAGVATTHGQCRRAARAPAGVEVALVAHLGVGRGDGGARHPQRVGQRAFAGQPGADRQAGRRRSASAVRRTAPGTPARWHWRCASCPVRGPVGPHRAGGRPFLWSFMPVCPNWILKSKPVASPTWSHVEELDATAGPDRPRLRRVVADAATALRCAARVRRRPRQSRAAHRPRRHPRPIPGPRMKALTRGRRAAGRAGAVRLLDGTDGACRPGTGPVGRVPPGAVPAHRLDHRDRHGDRRRGGAAGVDSAAQPARHRHRCQRHRHRRHGRRVTGRAAHPGRPAGARGDDARPRCCSTRSPPCSTSVPASGRGRATA